MHAFPGRKDIKCITLCFHCPSPLSLYHRDIDISDSLSSITIDINNRHVGTMQSILSIMRGLHSSKVLVVIIDKST